jgi:predicted PurR-regulated permease PerM
MSTPPGFVPTELPPIQVEALPSPLAVEPAPAEDAANHGGVGAVRLIAVLVSLAACWLASSLLVPIMLGLMLALIGNPLVSRLARWRIPRWLGALGVVVGGLALAIWLGSLLVTPATEWMKDAPAQMRQVAPKLKQITRQVDRANKAAASLVTATGAATTAPTTAADPDAPRPPNLWTLIGNAPRALASVLAVVLLAYFFLVYGKDVQRHVIARLPGEEQKRLTVEILRRIEADLSRYVLTISTINVAVGIVLAASLFWLGLDLADALLWGTLAALFNFVPYVGPLTGVLLMVLVGVVAFDEPWHMAAPALVYLFLHGLESQIVTPIVLGRRMAISPLVMLLWLMLWGFLWGIAGLLLAVPMLASLKIVAERVEGWQGWATLIE